MKSRKIVKPELISPAGDLEKLKIAFMYGADAVYASTPKFSMRTREIGFTDQSIKEGIDYAHSIGKKVYLTLNVFPHSGEIKELKKHALKIIKLHPDAIIVADPGVLAFVKENTDIPVHLSTQANTTNHLAANFWQEQGVERIVLARELSLMDIETLTKNSTVEIEAFVQGAMCMAYSGRCQISNYLTGRDPNKGACVQACRFKYKMYGLEEEIRPGEILPIFEDDRGSYVLNSKDLCMIEHIDELVKAGIGSFKIEGRLKSVYYVGAVTRLWREAIDLYFEVPKKYESAKKYFKQEAEKISNRGYTTGFYFHKPNSDTNNYESSKAKSEWGYIGLVKDYDKVKKMLKIEVKNYLPLNSELEIISPNQILKHKLTTMFKKDESIDCAHADNIIEIPFSKQIAENSFLRIKLPLTNS